MFKVFFCYKSGSLCICYVYHRNVFIVEIPMT